MLKLAKLNGSPEIFYSIQGEGSTLGKPTIFVRLSLCNLHCFWCDTDYTWNWEGTSFNHTNDTDVNYKKFKKSDWIIEKNTTQIIELVKKYNCKRVVFTGGEPLIQQSNLINITKLLNEEGYYIELETNGTILPSDKLDLYINQYNVSPKLENSHNSKKYRFNKTVLNYFNEKENSFFKFVVSNRKDLNEIEEIATVCSIHSYKIYLMPEGTSAQSLSEKKNWLVEICKTYGYNFTTRLHIELYDNKKGV